MEKLAEERTYTQNIPFTDRTDYLSSMSNNLGYCLAVEKLAGIETPPRGQAIRVIMAELQRLASHCMGAGAFANDTGAWQTPIMWFMCEREKILDIFEMTSGARLTCNYMRIGGVAFDLPAGFEQEVREFLGPMAETIATGEGLLSGNEIFQARSRNVAVVPPEMAINASLSGPMLRGSGIAWDIREGRPLLRLRAVRLRYPHRLPGRLLRPLHRAAGRDAPEPAHHRAGARRAAWRPRTAQRCRWRCARPPARPTPASRARVASSVTTS